jgi:aspartate 1-decarboxylase
MLRLLKAKIHRATVTCADVDYEGSVAIDRLLMEATDILPNEAVDIWNVTQGTRLTTYAIEAPAGSGTISINGAAARLNAPGDIVILAVYAYMSRDEALRHVPSVVFVDGQNRITEKRAERIG